MLNKIIASTVERVELQKRTLSLNDLENQVSGLAVQEPLFIGSSRSPFFITEVKFSSPSEGSFESPLSPVEVAEKYVSAGADALSVLTEPQFFKGSIEKLSAIREAFPMSTKPEDKPKKIKDNVKGKDTARLNSHQPVRILMKDFIIDRYQIFQAKLVGADAVLLISEVLSADKLKSYVTLARRLGLATLVEVHEPENLSKAYLSDSPLIGVNNRCLKTMTTSIDKSLSLSKQLSRYHTHVSESGISNHEQVCMLISAGYHGFLVGSHLMKSNDPGVALKNLRGL